MESKSNDITVQGHFIAADNLVANMASREQKRSYMGMCANIIRDNYNGDPLALEPFLDKLALIEDLTDENRKTTVVTFLKSKLKGKAREALPENVSTVKDIKAAQKEKLKPDNSKIIAGKIAALTVRNNNFTEFAKQAEDLADALKRSLTIKLSQRTKFTRWRLSRQYRFVVLMQD